MDKPLAENPSWREVITTDYYGAWEDIKDFCLPEDGELFNQIWVKWPDGSISQEQLHIDRGEESAQIDMNGRPDTFSTRSLYIVKSINGRANRIYLRGLYILPVDLRRKEKILPVSSVGLSSSCVSFGDLRYGR